MGDGEIGTWGNLHMAIERNPQAGAIKAGQAHCHEQLGYRDGVALCSCSLGKWPCNPPGGPTADRHLASAGSSPRDGLLDGWLVFLPSLPGSSQPGWPLNLTLRSRVLKTTNPAHGRVCCFCRRAYLISTARLSWIFLFQIAGPVICTDSPLVSTATVTGMSFTSNS